MVGSDGDSRSVRRKSKDGLTSRISAPNCEKAELVIEQPELQVLPMSGEKDDRFHAVIDDPQQPVLYRFRLKGEEMLLPDPASRFQPDGLHGPSEVIDPSDSPGRTPDWPGVGLEGQIIYEMHIGTFTPEGTWRCRGRAACRRLAAIGDHADRDDADRGFPGPVRLGLRRRRSVRSHAALRAARRSAPLRRRRPRARDSA